MYEPGLSVRRASESDLESLSRLVYRFYSFNQEFDPAWALDADAENIAAELAKEYISGEDLVLVADYDNEVVGYIRIVVMENRILASKRLGVIKELYVLPPFRGRGIASRLIAEAQKRLEEAGVKHIAAEFPSANYVAEEFYKSLRFRPYMSMYLREV
ncbi:MAG: GNAT family N-acetyltransferase [Desulfurococcales archaeon]|nr:GNAT family N-acetyltransferase [Desulfurococcales archaeon]